MTKKGRVCQEIDLCLVVMEVPPSGMLRSEVALVKLYVAHCFFNKRFVKFSGIYLKHVISF